MSNQAPGKPGIPARWTSSAKSGVGTAISGQSRLWFSISHGIINEVYYPRIDQANTRDLGFLVADGADFFSEEKRDATHEISLLAHGVPGYQLTNTGPDERYRIHKTVIADPNRAVLLQHVTFEVLKGDDLSPYVLLAPHIANEGNGNTGWIGDYRGLPMLYARRKDTVLALACSIPFKGMSCGYVGESDGWQDINQHHRMTWFYDYADEGNIALTAQIDLAAAQHDFVIALAFGLTAAEAGHRARASLVQDFERVKTRYVQGWLDYQNRCTDLERPNETGFDLYRISTAVLKTHQAKRFRGGMIASLSIPWGAAKGDADMGGYHLVWSRDLVESAGGLLAAGDMETALDTLVFLIATQDPDGHWPQNMWLDGSPYWQGIQMDETAFPILLADAMRRLDALDRLDLWPMVRRASGFLVRNGPVTGQDRWEEDGGYSPFTLAVEIAGLLAAADFADEAHQSGIADYLRQTADGWNAQLEHWTYVTGTDLAEQVGVEGYYVRIAPPETADAASPVDGFVPIKNRPPDQSSAPLVHIVSPDALALVRFGLRSADDPRIVNTVKVIDALLKTETQAGPVWHRYNQDGYGEHDDGSPFDGTGTGRGWPLLAGERGHYELARGNTDAAERLLKVMSAQTSPGGYIPEQIWDANNIPEHELFNGKPSGSAMPLVWAHAEYIKLLRSLRDRHVFDMPPQPLKRYRGNKTTSPYAIWRFNHKVHQITTGDILRLEVLAPATVRWSNDGWQTSHDLATTNTSLGVHFADLPSDELHAGTDVVFTFFWEQDQRWQGEDFMVIVQDQT
jgi:glucoamylase